MDIITIELIGTKAKKAESKGFCSRQKPAHVTGMGKANNYSTERSTATENGTLTTFEAMLLGSLGLSAKELVFIFDNCDDRGLFRWGNSRKVLEVRALGSGASKKSYHFSEYRGDGDGFVVKFNWSDHWFQTAKEAETYERLINEGHGDLVSKIYRYDPHRKSENVARVHNINGKECKMVIDGIIYAEYCHSVGETSGYSHIAEFIGDVHSANVGKTANGRVVCIDYGI